MVALVVVHPGAAVAGKSRGHLATSVGHTSHAPRPSPVAGPVTTTTVPVRPAAASIPTPVTPTTGTATTVPTTTIPTTTPPARPAPAVIVLTVLPANIAPVPNFLQSCSGAQYDDSAGCVDATVQAIANGRSHENLPPLVLPSNWFGLSPEQQVFVVTNLERTVRGLPPLSAMATTLDQAARQGAALNTDPPPPGGFPYSQWGSNWAGAVGNPLEAMYFWMYDDGTGSANVDCGPSNESGCWGHRENVLLKLPCADCLIGTGWVGTGYGSDPSMTELLVETSGSPSVDFTWREEAPYLG
jgi:uncharacterized protein YkwD